MYTIKKGLDLPISGKPAQVIKTSNHVKKAAIIGPDFHGMKPTMLVKVGDSVKLGSPLFKDKKNEGVVYTSPAAGKVTEINRGHQRYFQSIVISLAGNDYEPFKVYSTGELSNITRQDAQDHLVKTGLWPSLRTRPFSKAPSLGSVPSSIFVNCMDTNPLSPDNKVILKGQENELRAGLDILRALTNKVYLCAAADTTLPNTLPKGCEIKRFCGPHPAGLSGTHIHFIDPVGKEKTVWWTNVQDIISFGRTFLTGKLDVSRIISVAGPAVKDPCLVRTIAGASTEDLLQGLLKEGENRTISGSVLAGRTAQGPLAYLGRFSYQISVLLEGRHREFLGWQKPGFNKFSVKKIFASALSPGKLFNFTTSTEGSLRAMVPIGSYESVMPMDIEPTFMLRSLLTQDTEQGQLLGVLELDEEDLGLCTFVCATKEEYGQLLRESLTKIERDG